MAELRYAGATITYRPVNLDHVSVEDETMTLCASGHKALLHMKLNESEVGKVVTEASAHMDTFGMLAKSILRGSK